MINFFFCVGFGSRYLIKLMVFDGSILGFLGVIYVIIDRGR